MKVKSGKREKRRERVAGSALREHGNKRAAITTPSQFSIQNSPLSSIRRLHD